MLRMLIGQSRRRAGRFLALLYLFCVIGPPVALAFADGLVAAHCLTGDHHLSAGTRAHLDAGAHGHDHAGSDTHRSDFDGDGVPGNCCGLFCLNATNSIPNIVVAAIVLRESAVQQSFEASLRGHDPDRIDRPPRYLASL